MIPGEHIQFLQQRGRRYLVGTPKSALKELEHELLAENWETVREGIEGHEEFSAPLLFLIRPPHPRVQSIPWSSLIRRPRRLTSTPAHGSLSSLPSLPSRPSGPCPSVHPASVSV